MEFPPSAVGTAVYAHRLAAGLSDKEVEVLVLAPQTEGAASFDRRQIYAVERMPTSRLVPRRYALGLSCLRRHLAKFAPDCLWTTNGTSTRIVGLMGDLPRLEVPVVASIRGSDVTTRLPGKGLVRRLESIPQRRCLRFATAIVAASHYLKQVAVAKGVEGAKIAVNYSAFDFAQIEEFRFDPERLWSRYPFLKGRRIVLSVGRLERQKCMRVAAAAVGQISRRHPDVCHVVVGDGPELPRLRRWVAAQGLTDHIFLLGRLPPMSPPLYELFSAAQLFLLVSVREGLGNVFIEAGAFGLPSVGARDGGVPEVVVEGRSGLLAAPGDVEDTAAQVDRLLGDGDLRRCLGAGAHAWVKTRFRLEEMTRRSSAVLEKAMAARRAPHGLRPD